MTFGKIIENKRKKKKLSQIELGKLAGITRNTVYNIEKGFFNPSSATLVRLMKILELSQNDIASIIQENN